MYRPARPSVDEVALARARPRRRQLSTPTHTCSSGSLASTFSCSAPGRCRRSTAALRRDMLEIIDERFGCRATLMTSEIPPGSGAISSATRPRPTPSATARYRTPTASTSRALRDASARRTPTQTNPTQSVAAFRLRASDPAAHHVPILPFTMDQSRRSRWSDPSVHQDRNSDQTVGARDPQLRAIASCASSRPNSRASRRRWPTARARRVDALPRLREHERERAHQREDGDRSPDAHGERAGRQRRGARREQQRAAAGAVPRGSLGPRRASAHR